MWQEWMYFWFKTRRKREEVDKHRLKIRCKGGCMRQVRTTGAAGHLIKGKSRSKEISRIWDTEMITLPTARRGNIVLNQGKWETAFLFFIKSAPKIRKKFKRNNNSNWSSDNYDNLKMWLTRLRRKRLQVTCPWGHVSLIWPTLTYWYNSFSLNV